MNGRDKRQERRWRRTITKAQGLREPVEHRRRSCDGCGRSRLLKDLRCDGQFSGFYCPSCLPVPGTAYRPGSATGGES